MGGRSLPRRLERLLRKLGTRIVDGSGSWSVPYSWADPALPVEVTQMRWRHVTIIGALVPAEQVAHTFNFRTHPTPDVDQDAAAGALFAQQVGTAWAAFIHSTRVVNVSDILSHNLRYTEVRAAYLQQNQPATVTTHQGKRGPVKDFHVPRAEYLVPTQYYQFPANTVKGTAAGQ